MNPRWYQFKAEEAVVKYFLKHPEMHPLVALPTGSGKSLVMAMLAKHFLKDEQNSILLISHDARILTQNFKTMKTVCDPSLYSVGLKSWEVSRVTIAGIQSIYKHPELFPHFTHVFIDECHTIPMSETSMYRKFLNNIGKHTRIGFTATPFRLGQGYIIGEDHLFDKIVIDMTFGAKYTRLVDEGYLSRLVINNTTAKMDTKDIKLQGGDFNLKQMSDKFDRESITNAILDEMIIKGSDRKKWLIFAIDIEHCDHICEGLIGRGISSMSVHSKSEVDPSYTLNQHKNEKIRAVVSVGMLTTGYDDPSIDLIGLLRPTKSPNLHVQMPGRGQRIAKGKKDCLVLDYAGNTKRLGPINRVNPRKKGKKKEGMDPITKTCPECDTILAPIVKICPTCGYEFKFKSGLELESSDTDIIHIANKWFNVSSVEYTLHKKNGSPDGIKATYQCGLRQFNDWILPNHKGYAGIRGIAKLKQVGVDWSQVLIPDIFYKDKKICNITFLVKFLNSTPQIKIPAKILIDNSGQYSNVVDVYFESDEIVQSESA